MQGACHFSKAPSKKTLLFANALILLGFAHGGYLSSVDARSSRALKSENERYQPCTLSVHFRRENTKVMHALRGFAYGSTKVRG